MKLNFKNAVNELIDLQAIKKIKDYPSVIIFGAGESGVWVCKQLISNGIIPVCFCDNSTHKWGININNISVMSFEQAICKYPNSAICVSSMWFEEIYNQICKYDISLKDNIYNLLNTMAWETTNNKNKSNEVEFIKSHYKEFLDVYNLLNDEISKRTLGNILNYRLTRHMSYIAQIKSFKQAYLDTDIIDLNCNYLYSGVFIDGGAFDGDTVDLFSKCLDSKHLVNVHCYEPDNDNANILSQKIKKNIWEPYNVILHKSALWSENTILRFSGNLLSAHIVENNGIDILAQKLDDCIKDKVSYIKLDLEGAERKALQGAKQIIKRDKPILAICAYHLQDDLLVLPKLIKSFNQDYKLYLRHYMLSSGDTVLYAIPNI